MLFIAMSENCSSVVMVLINKARIMDSISEILNSVRRLRSMADMSLSDFASDSDHYAIAEHHLRRSLEMILDVGRHIIAKQGLGRPADYTEVFDILGREGILPPEYVQKNRGLPGYRNRLVHVYHEVTVEELHAIISTRLQDIEQFCRHIADYLDSLF